MAKKTVKKRSQSITLEINKKVADALGINKKTDLIMAVVDDVLIVKAKNKKSSTKRKKRLQDITSRLIDKYEPVLKKLAKT
jgi:hypothetical protein